MSKDRPCSIHGINFTQEQYDKLHEAQAKHDKACDVLFDEYCKKCDVEQKKIDDLWNKFCEENRR